MSDEWEFGYCTNVHAGGTLQQVLDSLDQYAVAVREQVSSGGRLQVGLWFGEQAAQSLLSKDQSSRLRQWLDERDLVTYTINGFPQGDFHRPVVKHDVYQPTWLCQSRARHTQSLALLLQALLPEGKPGSISTLPLGWPHAPWHADDYRLAADHLLSVARFLDRLSQQRGSEIVLALEPEPGCLLDTAGDVLEFFEKYLLSGPDAQVARQYLTVCHDICHSCVMFEPQQMALDRYRGAGIRVGKVQVSSAIHVPWDQVVDQPSAQDSMLQQVQSFSEPKYLHQTTRCDPHGHLESFSEDLTLALTDWIKGERLPTRPWRIHFHLPIFVNRFEHLTSTASDIQEACNYLEKHRHTQVAQCDWFTGHYEVETYAWTVLPPQLASTDLADGIARELQCFHRMLSSARTP